MKITTVLPVSRIKYLDRVLDSLLKQTIKIENLVVVFDGSDEDFVKVRNIISETDIPNRLCVKSLNRREAQGILERRWHIASIHNQLRGLIGECDLIFSVEDDGILLPTALENLLETYKKNENVGMVTGVELGRWGLPYVGAWHVDDIEKPKRIQSIENRLTDDSGVLVEEIDACGLYCALIKAEPYRQYEFDVRNGLGPDVNLGIHLRQLGYQNYVDWRSPVTHLTFYKNKEIEIPADGESRIVALTLLSGNTWKQNSA